MDIPAEEKQQANGSPCSVLAASPTTTAMQGLSPRRTGSNLFDSFELQAITKQLNRAIQGSNVTRSPFTSYLKSPICHLHLLNDIFRDHGKASKRISSCRQEDGTIETKASTRSRQGVVPRLWKKIKPWFFTRSKV